jgi:ABC-type polysaccharide/polyol phosphate transport system ATPase subunit
LIDLNAGFHPDLTGYQNIYLNGMLLGMNETEITRKLHAIIHFADIGQFIDIPLYTYSSGMALRLGFSVAVHADPDILLLDEGLAVGDLSFQKKARQKIQQLFGQEKTVITVSHRLDFIRENCQRILELKRGNIVADGSISILNTYQNDALKQ